VKPIFEKYVKQHGLDSRVKFHECDFFNQPLPRADVIVMGHILHDWDEPTKRMLAKKALDALPAGGAFIAYDAMIDDDRRTNAFGLLMSINMLLETPGGFDYTGAQAKQWFTDAGFKSVEIVPLVGPDSMAIGWKS
jgi:hypothetical protein